MVDVFRLFDNISEKLLYSAIIQNFEEDDFLQKVSLKILNSGKIFETFTCAFALSTIFSWVNPPLYYIYMGASSKIRNPELSKFLS